MADWVEVSEGDWLNLEKAVRVYRGYFDGKRVVKVIMSNDLSYPLQGDEGERIMERLAQKRPEPRYNTRKDDRDG